MGVADDRHHRNGRHPDIAGVRLCSFRSIGPRTEFFRVSSQRIRCVVLRWEKRGTEFSSTCRVSI